MKRTCVDGAIMVSGLPCEIELTLLMANCLIHGCIPRLEYSISMTHTACNTAREPD